MGFLDFIEKIGAIIENFWERKFVENDKHIKAIYTTLAKAEQDLKNWNYAIDYAERGSKDPKKENLPKRAKDMKEKKLEFKADVLKSLKREINNILREF